MTLLKEAEDQKKFDTRVIEKNVDRGRITPKEAEAQGKSLKNDESNAIWTDIDQLKNSEPS